MRRGQDITHKTHSNIRTTKANDGTRISARSITTTFHRLPNLDAAAHAQSILENASPPRRSSRDRNGVHQNQPRSSSANPFSKQTVPGHDRRRNRKDPNRIQKYKEHTPSILPLPSTAAALQNKANEVVPLPLSHHHSLSNHHHHRHRHRSEAHSVHDPGSSFVVLLFGDPHFLKRGQRRQDGAPDPD